MKLSDQEIYNLRLKHDLINELYQNTEKIPIHKKIFKERPKKSKYKLVFREKEINLQFNLFTELRERNIKCYLESTIVDGEGNSIGEIDIVVEINEKFIGIECKKYSSREIQNLAKSHKNQLIKYKNLLIPIIFIANSDHIIPIIESIISSDLENKIYGYFDVVQKIAQLIILE